MKWGIGIILLTAFLRFFYLTSLPTSLSGDELHYAVTAKSIMLTGHDISGTWNPLTLLIFHHPPDEQQAELPYLLHLASGARLPFSVLGTKLPFVLLSIGIVVLLYLIAFDLFDRPTAIAVSFVAAINPWLIVMGRTAYEGTPATFFYLLGLLILLRTKGYRLYWSIAPFLLAFYAYIGTKLIFVPFIFMACILSWYLHKHTYTKYYAVVILWSILLTFTFIFFIQQNDHGGRLSEIFLPTSPLVTAAVNEARRTTVQSQVLPLLVNKYSVYGEIIITRLFRIFSSSYLFADGDQFFLPIQQGFLYYIDAFFMILGACALYAKSKMKFFIIVLFIFIGTLPHVFHAGTGDFSAHLALMFPFLLLLVGNGIVQIFRDYPKQKTAIVVIAFFYAVSFSGFATTYFFQYPLQGTGDYHKRVITKYLEFAKKHNVSASLYSTSSQDIFSKYLFYTNQITSANMPFIRKQQGLSSFTFQNILFTPCNQKITASSDSETIILDANCDMHISGANVHIARPSDAGTLYQIYNDKVCSAYSLSPYPNGLTLPDFDLENIQEEKFCKLFINR